MLKRRGFFGVLFRGDQKDKRSKSEKCDGKTKDERRNRKSGHLTVELQDSKKMPQNTVNTVSVENGIESLVRARYLLACLTLGLGVLVPLFKCTVASSKCLATSSTFDSDNDLRAFFKAFVAHLLKCCPLPRRTLELGKGDFAAAPSPFVAAQSFFTGKGCGQRFANLFDVNVYPPLVTGVVRPLDALRRSMQPIPISEGEKVKDHPHHLYISGKVAASQPLACMLHGITHIVRCYALPEGGEPFCVSTGSVSRLRTSLLHSNSTQKFTTQDHQPSDRDMLLALLEKGGEWVVCTNERRRRQSSKWENGAARGCEEDLRRQSGSGTGCAVMRENRANYDRLEFPVAMLREGLGDLLRESLSPSASKDNKEEEDGSSSNSSDTAVYTVERLTIPAVDDESYDISQHFNTEVFGFISQAVAGGGKVLVHCSAGKHRSAAVVAAYLIDLQVPERVGVGRWHGLSVPPSPQAIVERCYRTIKAARPIAEPTANYERQLQVFAKDALLGLMQRSNDENEGAEWKSTEAEGASGAEPACGADVSTRLLVRHPIF